MILYNPAKHKQEWHTVNGTKKDAVTFGRQQKTRQSSGGYIAKSERRTFAEVAAMFLKERAARNRRTSTCKCYESILNKHLVPAFGPKEVGTIRRSDIAEYFDGIREKGSTVQTVNRCLRTLKAVLFFALERELVERNVMQRFRPFEGGKEERHVNRDAFSESEIQALISAAKDPERAFIGPLAFTGMRPGEVYALDWSSVDLEGGAIRVTRSWCDRSKTYVAPKTKAGLRVVPLSGWLVAELTAHRARGEGTGLVFPNGAGKPLGTSNTRRDVWLPLRERAGVRPLDMYSLRHTFASLGRTAGESSFNVSRVMGHSKSTLVDAVYAHSMQSGLSGVAENVTARALGLKPQLRVIEGGNRQDVRETLDDSSKETASKVASA